jgi:hypothetical protein
VWFGLAYRQRHVALWEPVLVLIGGVLALARLGNAWMDAAAMLAPLARRFAIANPKFALRIVLTVGCLVVATLAVVYSRPPDLPSSALQEGRLLNEHGAILAYWRWAGELQHEVGPRRVVLASGGLSSELSDFWLDYIRIGQGHEHWAELLRQMDVDTVVLESGDEQRALAQLVSASPDWDVIYAQEGVLEALRVQ